MKILKILILSLSLLSSVSHSGELTDPLVAISVKGAIEAASSFDEDVATRARSVGGITRPRALIIHDDDILLVGEAIRGEPTLRLGDLKIAFLNADPADVPIDPCYLENPSDAPFRVKGLSLEPNNDCAGEIIDSSWTIVDYRLYQLRGAEIGRDLALIDTWLKAAAMSGIPMEHPSEFQFELARYKLGFRINPDRNRPVASFLYPAHVPIMLSNDDQVAVVRNVSVRVVVDEPFIDPYHNTLFEAGLPADVVSSVALQLDAESVASGDFKETKDILRNIGDNWRQRRQLVSTSRAFIKRSQDWDDDVSRLMPYGASPSSAFADLLSQSLPEFEERYPFLKRYRNFSGLMGLFVEMRDRIPADVANALEGFEPIAVDTPSRVQTLRQGAPGLAVPVEVSGGLSITSRTKRLAKAAQPSALRDVTLASMPDTGFVWLVHLGETAQAGSHVPARNDGGGIDVAKVMSEIGLQTDQNGDWVWVEKDASTNMAGSWEVESIDGDNLLEFVAQASITTGHESLFVRPDELTLEPFQTLFGLTYELKARAVLSNVWEIGLTAPLKYEFVQTPDSLRLPGLVDFGSVAGLGNITLDSKYQLKSGAGKSPSAHLHLHVTTPVRSDAWNTTSVGGSTGGWSSSEAVEYPIGIDGWSYALGLSLSLPIGERSQQSISAYAIKQDFEDVLGNPVDDLNYLLGLDTRRLLGNGRTIGVSLNLSAREDQDLGYQVMAFIEKPTRNRALRYAFGLSREANGDVLYSYSVDIGFERLFRRWQKWY